MPHYLKPSFVFEKDEFKAYLDMKIGIGRYVFNNPI